MARGMGCGRLPNGLAHGLRSPHSRPIRRPGRRALPFREKGCRFCPAAGTRSRRLAGL